MNNDLISRSALKEEISSACYNCASRDEDEYNCKYHCPIYDFLKHIDNTPTVSTYNLEKHYFIEGFKEGCEHGKKCYERPQGECKSCRHRDPEDKKCDCGGQERQGCLFPVSDDYYCKYYERGKEE